MSTGAFASARFPAVLTPESDPMPTIHPEKDYPFPEAARLIPSPLTRAGCLTTNTLHRWRKLGLIRARVVHSGKRQLWVISGRELLRLLRLRIDRQPLGTWQRHGAN
jgi:hypothetical protein